MSRIKIKALVLSGLFAALVCLFTAYIFHIPIGSGAGYIHFGDGFLYIAAAVLPWPNAMLIGAVGGGLADFLSGTTVWVPFTAVIKPLMALCFTNRGAGILTRKRNRYAPLAAGILGLFGYFIAETMIYGNFLAAAASAGFGLAQVFGSAALYYILAAVMDHRKLKELIFR